LKVFEIDDELRDYSRNGRSRPRNGIVAANKIAEEGLRVKEEEKRASQYIQTEEDQKTMDCKTKYSPDKRLS
jgi:hypothetical protein